MKKISYATNLAYLVFLCFFTNCTFNKSVASSSLKNKTISLYVSKIGGAFDKDLFQKKLIFRFDSSGKYKATLDGQFYKAGDYSYHYSNNKGRLLYSYSDSSRNFEYEMDLIFETNTSGTWSGTYSNNPGINKAENGTFEFIN